MNAISWQGNNNTHRDNQKFESTLRLRLSDGNQIFAQFGPKSTSRLDLNWGVVSSSGGHAWDFNVDRNAAMTLAEFRQRLSHIQFGLVNEPLPPYEKFTWQPNISLHFEFENRTGRGERSRCIVSLEWNFDVGPGKQALNNNNISDSWLLSDFSINHWDDHNTWQNYYAYGKTAGYCT